MALYSVYDRKNAGASVHEKVRLIKQGFSWLAFAFPLVWLLLNRVWRWFLVVLALEIGLALLIDKLGLPDWTLLLVGLTVMLFVGISARDWLGAALERRGFKMMGTFAGADEDEAYAAYVRRPKPRAATIAEAKPAKSPENGPVIGLFPDPEARF